MKLKEMNPTQALQEFGLALPLTELTKILSTALRNGGSLAELFFECTESSRVTLEDSKVDQIIDGIDRGVGLRIIHDNRSVYGSTTDLSVTGITQLAHDLSASIQPMGGKPFEVPEYRLSRQDHEVADYQVQASPRRTSLKEKTEIVFRIEKAAKKILPEARQISAVLLDAYRKILVVNSDGLVAPTDKTYISFFCEVVGQSAEGVETAFAGDGSWMGTEFFKIQTPESIGEKAASRVKLLLTAKPAPSGVMTVVLAGEAGGTMIHEAVGHGLEADLACNGLSVYQGKVGQQVASPLITVVDDGTMEAKRGSFVFDDEGTPSQKNVLIENGILKGYMVDRLSAMKFDMMATGNGRRETFRHKPIVRMTNTYIAAGKDDPAQILKDTKKGIYVKAMGGGQVNTVSGDFVFAVTEGYLIEDGKLGAPIRNATLVGNGPKVMMEVDRVGNDVGFVVGTCGKDGQGAPVTDGQPTIRIPNLTVGGVVPAETYWK